MINKAFQLSLILMFTLFCSTLKSQTIIFEEDFTGVPNLQLPTGWTTTAETPDAIYAFDGSIVYFQESLSNSMILISPIIDFTGATSISFDFTPITISTNTVFEVGIMLDPEDPGSFQSLSTFVPDDGNLITTITYSVHTLNIVGNAHLAFRGSGSSLDYYELDNVVLSEEELNWPEAVSNVIVTPDNDGATTASLAWLNPSLEVGGNPLTELDSVTIGIDGEIIFTLLNPEIGGNADAQLDVEFPGIYRFEIISYNESGAGNMFLTPELWIGLDIPGSVSNLILNETNNNIANLSWEAPVQGAHGGWFDGSITEYKIVRADGHEYTADESDTSFTATLDIPGTYTFNVIPVNSSGEGTEKESNADAFYFNGYLLWEDFWISVPALDWNITGDSPLSNWSQIEYNSFGSPPEMLLFPEITFDGVSNVLSPIINTEGLSLIKLQFDHEHYHGQSPETYMFKIVTSSSNSTSWNEVYSIEIDESTEPENLILSIENEDVGAEDFQFAFVFEGSSSSIEGFLIDNVRLYESFDIDLAAKEILLPDWIFTGDDIKPKGKLENLGTTEVDYTAIMSVNTGSTVIYSSEVSGTLENGLSDEIEFENWEAQEGAFIVEFEVITQGDENTENQFISRNIEVNNNEFSRTLVICEEFTGTWCSFCPGVALGLDDLILNNFPVAVVAYHVDDVYENDEAQERSEYYDVLGFPTTVFDGTTIETGGHPSASLYDTYLPIVEQSLSVASPASVNINNLEIANNIVTADIRIDSESSINNPNLVLHSIINESHIEEEWLGLSEVNFVERSMYNGAAGVPVDLTDQTETVSVTFELEDSWDIEHSELVVFVQDKESKVVLNGNKSDLPFTSSTQSIEGIKLELYPNPTRDVVNINCESILNKIEIYNQIGKLKKEIEPNTNKLILNTSDLPDGFYLLKILTESGHKTLKLLIN